jgi:hypothetical protein
MVNFMINSGNKQLTSSALSMDCPNMRVDLLEADPVVLQILLN